MSSASDLRVLHRIPRFLGRTVRAVGIIARDGRIPRPLRALAALALLPIPGPFDEAVLLLLALPLFVFYRRSLKDAWQQSLASTDPTQLSRGEGPERRPVSPGS